MLSTKLFVPHTSHAFVSRPRLNDRLSTGLHDELPLVSAPAGSGKTALLADWSRHSSWPVAWLSLDAGDNDPAQFWDYVGAALPGAGAAVHEGARPRSRNRRGP